MKNEKLEKKLEPFIKICNELGLERGGVSFNEWLYAIDEDSSFWLADLVGGDFKKFDPKIYRFEIRYSFNGKPYIADIKTKNNRWYRYTRAKTPEKFRETLIKEMLIFKEYKQKLREYELNGDFV